MKKARSITALAGVFIFLFSFGSMSGEASGQTTSKTVQTKPKTASKTTQTKTKSSTTGSKAAQTKTKSGQPVSKTKAKAKPVTTSTKTEPAKPVKDASIVMIGTQSWAIANLNVSTFRNGDSIPQARTNKEWVTAGESGKPAWCYYNNDPAMGVKYGKLYNWYAVNDPRGLAPAGWILSTDADWAKLAYSLGGPDYAGNKMKSLSGWTDGNNGTNEAGFSGLPGGYRIENGIFQNLGSIGIWWSTTESRTQSAFDHYLMLSGGLGRSTNPKQRGESVRCLRN